MIKAIDTYYNGNYFRSRLEAKWAFFFDELKIDYKYEPEGYNVNGVMYLPDFYLPKYNCYCECKPGVTDWNREEVYAGIDKGIALAIELKQDFILVIDKPCAANIRYFKYALLIKLENRLVPRPLLIKWMRSYILNSPNAILIQNNEASIKAEKNTSKKRFEHENKL